MIALILIGMLALLVCGALVWQWWSGALAAPSGAMAPIADLHGDGRRRALGWRRAA